MSGDNGVGEALRSGDATSASGTGENATRHAVAHGRVTMLPATTAGVSANTLKKGDVLATARYAGTQATKQIASLVARAGAVSLPEVTIRFEVAETWIDIEARVDSVESVGVEPHALSAVTVAALTIYDMCKSADRTMMIGSVELLESSGM